MSASAAPFVDGLTQVYALLGHPVRHSLSPQMHNAAFRAAGIKAVYVSLEVAASRLEEALNGLHASGVRGLNLTTPHKEAAFSLATALTGDALEALAVNTLRWEEGGWRGHATDGVGFLAWITEARIDVKGRRVLLLGAGGAARSILPKLRALGPAEVRVVSRAGERAAALAEAAAGPGAAAPLIAAAAMRDEGAARAGGAWDLLIRALPTTLISAEEDCWWRRLSPAATVIDLNYAERSEPARERAAAGGRRYEDGLALLVHQGAASFEFWTGRRPALDAMKGALKGA